MKRSIAKRYHQADGRLNVMRGKLAINEQESSLSPQRLRYRGIAFVWTALVIFAIFLLVGLSIDWAKLMYNLHELQNASDAAALAGAQVVKVWPADETRTWTQEIASENTAERLDVYLRTTPQDDPFVDSPDVDIILGRWINNQHYFFPTLDAPDAVKVIARRAEGLDNAPALAFLYGPLVKVTKADAHRVAIGWYNLASGAGLIVLDEYPLDKQGNKMPGLFIAANVGDIRVIGGSIQVNTVWEGTKRNNDPPAAVHIQASGTMLASRLTVTGHTDPAPPTDEDNLNGWDNIWTDDTLVVPMEMPYDIWEGAPYMPDPLGPQGANIQPPVISEYPVRSYTKNTSTTLEPGYYPDGIEMTADGIEVNLQPGTYIIGGGNDLSQDSGLIQTGGALIGHGVLIYLTKDYTHTNGRWAQLDIGGNVVTDITPPGDESNPKVIDGLEGVSIWQDRLNTANQAQLHGGGGMMISGTLYFPNNHVYLAGNPGKAGNQLLCGSVEVFGRAQIVVEYDGRNNLSKGVSVLVK